MKLVPLLFILVSVQWSDSYNILVLFPFPGRSHFVSFVLLFKALSERGHNVTVVSDFPLAESIPNYRDVTLDIKNEVFNDLDTNDMLNLNNLQQTNRLHLHMMPIAITSVGGVVCDKAFSSTALQNLLEEGAKYDLILMGDFYFECFVTVAKKLKAPIVRLWACKYFSWVGYKYGMPNNPAYLSNNVMPFSNQMTFFERVENTIAVSIQNLLYFLLVVNRDKRISSKYFGEIGESLETDILNDSLLLTSTHFTVNLPRPLVPNVIEVGGIHIGKAKRLPENLEKWIKESPHGVIYFSFGSLVKGYTMPADKRQAFINAFKRLPQRVIWKWENDTMEGKSDNIMIGKWLPQFDILSHPNVKAFISHGGLLGTFEAVHCGVPILVMPQFGDQHTNAKAIESVGGGEILYLSDATEEKIYNALTKILSPSFQQQAKELSERFRDRPMPPLETAIYWVEYVARHKGAHFMKTAAVGMPFYQYYLLDVIAFLLAVLILFLYLVYLVLRFFVRLVFKPKQPTKVKKS